MLRTCGPALLHSNGNLSTVEGNFQYMVLGFSMVVGFSMVFGFSYGCWVFFALLGFLWFWGFPPLNVWKEKFNLCFVTHFIDPAPSA